MRWLQQLITDKKENNQGGKMLQKCNILPLFSYLLKE